LETPQIEHLRRMQEMLSREKWGKAYPKIRQAIYTGVDGIRQAIYTGVDGIRQAIYTGVDGIRQAICTGVDGIRHDCPKCDGPSQGDVGDTERQPGDWLTTSLEQVMALSGAKVASVDTQPTTRHRETVAADDRISWFTSATLGSGAEWKVLYSLLPRYRLTQFIAAYANVLLRLGMVAISDVVGTRFTRTSENSIPWQDFGRAVAAVGQDGPFRQRYARPSFETKFGEGLISSSRLWT
jgi:hypothetical protein